MNINNAVKIKGRFKLVVDNVETGEHKELGWQDNVVLNQILSSTVDKNGQYVYCLFGTGNTVPTVNDTSLAAPLATNHFISSLQYTNGSAADKTRVGEVHTRTITYKLTGTQGQVQGNVTELALATNITQATIFTRALIKNELGEPVTLTLGANDILTVYYAVSVITDCSVSTLATKTFMFNGQTITATLKLINQDIAPVLSDQNGLLSASWLSTGSFASGTPRLAGLFYYLGYITIANGNISNNRATLIGEVALVHSRHLDPPTPTNLNGQGVETKVGTYIANKEFAAGTATGTWKYLFLHFQVSSPANSQTEMNKCNFMVELNPPLVKAAADKFVFDTFSLISGGVPL